MKTLNTAQMQKIQGGTLTRKERADFVGVFSCVSMLFGGVIGAIAGGIGCADYLF